MLREIFIPDETNHSIELPKEWYGKKVEVIAFAITEVNDTPSQKSTVKTNGDFWDDIDYNPNFPSIEEIRKTAWQKDQQYISRHI